MDRIVLKIGGSELDREGFVEALIEALRGLWDRYAVALVHGGGKAIARLQERLSLQPRFIEGLRVTDDESLDVAEMVLSGLVNKRLVGRLVAAGVPAVGLSGVDSGLFRVVKYDHQAHDLGWVGDIRETHAGAVKLLLEQGITPVVSPISLGLDGHTYNVNADHAATALACALGAVELAFVSDVPGVLGGEVKEAPSPTLPRSAIPMAHGGGSRALPPGSQGGRHSDGARGGVDSGECIPTLTPGEVDSLITCGVIDGGMVPKVRSALAALGQGVARVRITDLEGLAVDGGTCFLAEEEARYGKRGYKTPQAEEEARYGKRGYKTPQAE